MEPGIKLVQRDTSCDHRHYRCYLLGPRIVVKNLLGACVHTFVFRPDVILDVSFSYSPYFFFFLRQDLLLALEAVDSGKLASQ